MVVSGYAMKKMPGDLEVCKFDGVDATGIYVGGLSDLDMVDVEWRTVFVAEIGEELKVLTLNEIAQQLDDFGLITVITNGPFEGKIYQYGNYSDGEWWEIGSTGGYA